MVDRRDTKVRRCPDDPQKVIIEFRRDDAGKLPAMYTGDEVQLCSWFGDIWYPIIRCYEQDERGQTIIFRGRGREELHLGRPEGYHGIRRIRRYPLDEVTP